MEFYLAPMEGLTGHIVRNAFHHNFNQIDKYYTPFIPAAKGMSKKIERDFHPDNNKGIRVIPQIMSSILESSLENTDMMKSISILVVLREQFHPRKEALVFLHILMRWKHFLMICLAE